MIYEEPVVPRWFDNTFFWFVVTPIILAILDVVFVVYSWLVYLPRTDGSVGQGSKAQDVIDVMINWVPNLLLFSLYAFIAGVIIYLFTYRGHKSRLLEDLGDFFRP